MLTDSIKAKQEGWVQTIVLGARQVDGKLTESLVGENEGITAIDTNNFRLRQLQDKFDLRTIQQQDSSVYITQSRCRRHRYAGCSSYAKANEMTYSLFNTLSRIANIRLRE